MKTKPVLALRHIFRETLAGFRGAVADVMAVRRCTDEPMTEHEQEALLNGVPESHRAGLVAEWADPYGLQKGIRLGKAESDRRRQAAERWLEEIAHTYPLLTDLAAVFEEQDEDGGSGAWELHQWMMNSHRRLSTGDEDVSPMAVLSYDPELVERLWREHVAVVTGPLP